MNKSVSKSALIDVFFVLLIINFIAQGSVSKITNFHSVLQTNRSVFIPNLAILTLINCITNPLKTLPKAKK